MVQQRKIGPHTPLGPLGLLTLAACGGGGGGGSTPTVSSSSSTTISGTAVAGPIDGAIAFVDYDEDGLLDVADEPYAYTDSDGDFSLTSTDADAPIVVTTDSATAGGLTVSAIDTSSDTGLSGVTLKAPAGSTVVSPTSTVAYDLIKTNGLTEAQVATALGLDGVSILSFNPYASGVDASAALAVEKVASQVMTTVKAVAAAAEGAGADAEDAANEAFSALVTVVQTKTSAGQSIDLANTTDLASVKTQAATNLATASGIDATAFNTILDTTMDSVKLINDAIKAITDTDLTSSATKGVLATSELLKTQAKAAATAEKASPGSGASNITLTDATTVSSAATAAANNAAPTDISLSATTIAENSSSLTFTATSTDDSSSSFTYALSGTDASYFNLNSSTGVLTLKASPDYETKTSYAITLTTADDAAIPKSYSEDFTISVSDVNEAPTLTVPTGNSVSEDASTTTITGTLTSSDPENDSPSYSIAGSNATNGSYSVSGTYGTLVLNSATGAFTYTLNNVGEATNALSAGDSKTESFSIQVTDGNNTSVAQSLSFTIKGANDAPSITASDLTPIDENQTNAIAATVSASDPEDGNKTVTLSGGGRDDGKFEIVDGKLRIKTSADYETQDSYQVQLSVTDTAGSTTLKNLQINVTNKSESLSGSIVDGYVAGATIFQDLDNDNVLDSGEPYTTTSSTGAFTLNSVVSSNDAPLKMISGFDIGTNQAIVTSLGLPSTITGAVVVSPISTVAAAATASSPETANALIFGRVADYLDISATSQAKLNVSTIDPISNLTNNDSDIVAAAKDIFEAGQLTMGLTHITESVGSYLATAVETAIQNAGETGYGSYAGGTSNDYKKIAADSFITTVADRIVDGTAKTSENAFQINAAKVVWTDYDPILQETITNRAVGVNTDGVLSVGSKPLTVNLRNLTNYSNGSDATVEMRVDEATISLDLIKVPIGSGSNTVKINLINGIDATRGAGERQIYFEFAVNWTADGVAANFVAPEQTVSGYYYTAAGEKISFAIEGVAPSLLTRNLSASDRNATFDVSITGAVDAFDLNGGTWSSSILTESSWTLAMDFDIPFYDANGAAVTSITNTVTLVNDTPLEIFVDDVLHFEDDASPKATIYLNHPHSEDVTVNYNIATVTGDTATAGTDFTAQTSQTATILAGLTSTTIALPILTDSSLESSETFTITGTSTSAGSFVKSNATVTLEDSDRSISSSGELDTIADALITNLSAEITNSLHSAYKVAADNAGASLSVTDSNFTTAASSVSTALGVVLKAYFGIISTEITNAAANNSAAADFAQALMTANAAAKLFDPSTIIGTYINGDGTYVGAHTLTSLTAALQSEYDTFKSYAVETVGDVFGTDTASNFASAIVQMLTDGNDSSTLTSSSEIIATFNGTDTVYAGAGNDKMIGGEDVDTLYGQAGADHLYGFRGNDILDGGDGNDILYGGLGNDTMGGGASDDAIYGGTGNDTITTGTGTDIVSASLGDDSITINGSGNKTIDGGAGTDSLSITYSGISGLDGFTVSSSGSTISLTDSSNNVINYSGIENLSVNSKSYTYINNGAINSGDGGISNAYWGATDSQIISAGSTVWYAQNIGTAFSGLSASDNLAYIGSASGETVNLNIDRSSTYTGNLTMTLGDGSDSILSAKIKNDDSINMGAGDDTMYVMVSGSNGTPSLSSLNMTLLDGGTGTDTLAFEESTVANGTTLNLTTGGATNFENLRGSASNETLNGDANANVLSGVGGNDTLNGLGGNDILYANAANGGAASSDSGTDNLYGGAGDDQLFGSAGENILDGGAGSDTLTGGNGSDTFVLRKNDSDASASAADIITDFTDGTDVFGLVSDLTFDDLTIAQSDGSAVSSSHTIISRTGEVMAVVQNTSASNITALDFSSTSTSALTLTGDSTDNTLIGGAGNDTATTGTGSDTVLTWGGDDSITINGSGNKTIDGGAGTDSLSITYSGISGLDGFTVSSSGSTISLTDSSNNVINYSGIENLSVNSKSYTYINNGAINSGDGGISNAYWGATDSQIISAGSTVWYAQNIGTAFSGLSASDNLAYIGSASGETVNLNIDRSSTYTGNLTMTLGDGSDSILSAKIKNDDSINMGAGDDTMYVMVSGSNGTPSLSSLNMTLLDGGTGTDTLAFEESTVANGTTLNLTTGGATNFENLRGSASNETLNGDANANVLSGVGGNDTLNGLGGNDILYANAANGGAASSDSGTDNLYGGAGDDQLFGSAGENILDGGAGSDTLTGGNGSDTFVLRKNDSDASASAADIITDFTDGTDVFGLVSDLTFDDLTIAQSDGSAVSSSHTIISRTGEVMAVVQNTSASNITALDFSSTSTSALTLTGDSTDNTLIGGAGNDTATTGTGSDTVLTWGGDDSITINGSGNKTIDGGAGTDSLSITYSGISGLDGFTVSSSGSTISLTDSSNNVINYSGIENLSVNSKSYTYINNGAINSGDGGISNAYWGATDSQIISAGSTVWYAQNIGTAFSGLSASDNLAYIGSASGETVNLNIDRSSTYTGNLTMTLGDGSDSILSAKIKNDDSINMGAGDDTMYVMVSGSNGTPSLSSLNMTLLDGGTGTDTLAFEESTVANGTTLNLTTGGATNFENLRGSASNETLNGDANANVLSGVGGNDTLNGLGGNDILYANAANGGAASSDSGTDNLYGGAGDDQLFGSAGENILDGGAGSDTLTGGNGSDTFVVRAADSGSDTITDFTSDDVLGLVDGLALADISTTVNGSNTEIYASSNLLVTLENYTSTLVAGDDYVVYEL